RAAGRDPRSARRRLSAGGRAGAARGRPALKISGVRTFLVPPQWLFVKVETDEGIAGWGEAGVTSRARSVAAAIDELAGYLIGASPLTIERHWQILTKVGFFRGGPILSSAVAAIDEALWDI